MEELEQLYHDINAQIEAIKQGTEVPEGSTIYQMRHPNGQWLLTDLLVAKSRVAYLLVHHRSSILVKRVHWENT